MDIYNEFYNWMYDMVDGRPYNTLLTLLYKENFYPLLPMDDNRITDGCNLRDRFRDEYNLSDQVMDTVFENDSCSVLEMMIGLAVRIEESIMSDNDFGDRTSMWFWIMIKSLGLYHMTDDNIDIRYIMETVDSLLNRGYEPNGEGGLFTVLDTTKDMRDLDIWYQMCMFFDKLL